MGSRHGGTPEKPALFFDGPEDFRAWLVEHHETETELWMGLNKKHVTDRGLTWEAAVPEALCFGWIDSRDLSAEHAAEVAAAEEHHSGG